jgi:hypothetical protein
MQPTMAAILVLIPGNLTGCSLRTRVSSTFAIRFSFEVICRNEMAGHTSADPRHGQIGVVVLPELLGMTP